MRRDRLLLTEILEAVERITGLTDERSLDDFESDRDRRDALLWNFTVLGEAVGQLSDATKDAHPGIAWMAPVRMRTASCMATGQSTSMSWSRLLPMTCPASPTVSVPCSLKSRRTTTAPELNDSRCACRARRRVANGQDVVSRT